MSTIAAVRERQILFTGPNVCAILDDRKSQTRRTAGLDYINENPEQWTCDGRQIGDTPMGADRFIFRNVESGEVKYIRCPYGEPGDRLWVRETWHHYKSAELEMAGFVGGTITQLDGHGSAFHRNAAFNPADYPAIWRKRPSIHMPRWASRLPLELTRVRVERLKEISEEDANAEGCESEWHGIPVGAVEKYEHLWDSLNKKRGFGWAVNPWVWVLDFRKVAA